MSEPMENGAAWEFFLYISNQTSHTLEVTQATKDWGTWYRDGKDKRTPINVKPGESVQAMGIRAAHGTATGYECRCVWSVKNAAGTIVSNVDLKIDVPYSQSNTSALTTSGSLRVEGWEGLPKSGHNFTRSITVSEVNALPCGDTSANDMDLEERGYYDMLMSNNETIRDWDLLQRNVPQKAQIDPLALIPTHYHYPPKETLLARSEKHTIARKFWPGLYDPVYTFEWQKDAYVEEYFSVGVYTLNTNPRSTVTIPRGVEIVKESTVEVTFSIANTLGEKLSIRSLLKGEYSGLTAELEATYETTHTLEESISRVERETETVTVGASEKNRLFVPWVFSTIIAVFRKKKDGKVELIGVSEWAEEILDQIYEY